MTGLDAAVFASELKRALYNCPIQGLLLSIVTPSFSCPGVIVFSRA
jgi:hypothetical protein